MNDDEFPTPAEMLETNPEVDIPAPVGDPLPDDVPTGDPHEAD